MLEAIATFFLMFVIYGTAVNSDAPKIGGLAIGLTIAADILAIGPLTGASMNPARSFGPALASGVFAGQIVYWVGPILGAIAAAMLWEFGILKPRAQGVTRPAVRQSLVAELPRRLCPQPIRFFVDRYTRRRTQQRALVVAQSFDLRSPSRRSPPQSGRGALRPRSGRSIPMTDFGRGC